MALYGVQGQWFGSLNVGGIDIPLDLRQMFHDITIRSHIHMDLPSLSLSFLDMGGLIVNKIVIRDGMPLVVAMGDGMSALPPAATFLCTGGPQTTPGPGADEVAQKALLAHPAWSKKIWDQATTGPSSAVIGRIAGEAGLKTIADTAQDSMKWLPNNRPLASYARFLSEHAWFGESSAPIQGIREDSTYVYKNLMQLISSAPTQPPIGNLTPGHIPYLEHMFTSKGKVYNAVRGMGSTTIYDPGSGSMNEFNKVTAKFPTAILGNTTPYEGIGIGKVWQQAVGSLGTRVEWSPIDGGNVHPNYHKAKHHNSRVKSLFSEDIKVLLDRQSGKDLLDLVEFYPYDYHTQSVIAAYAGNYICTGKMRMLKKQRYYEVLTLTSMGPVLLFTVARVAEVVLALFSSTV